MNRARISVTPASARRRWDVRRRRSQCATSARARGSTGAPCWRAPARRMAASAVGAGAGVRPRPQAPRRWRARWARVDPAREHQHPALHAALAAARRAAQGPGADRLQDRRARGLRGPDRGAVQGRAAQVRPEGHIGPSGDPAAVGRGRVAQAGRRRRHGRAAQHRQPGEPDHLLPARRELRQHQGPAHLDGLEGLRGRPQQGGRDRAPVRPEVRLPQSLLGVVRAR